MKNWRCIDSGCSFRGLGLAVILAAFLLNQAFSQTRTIAGTVRKAGTERPVPYASLIYDDNKGTVANEKGQFILTIDSSDSVFNVTVSSVGYKKKSISLEPGKLTAPLSIELHEEAILLPESIVEFKDIDSKKFMAQVVKSLENNLASAPFECDFFYRATISLEKAYTTFIESYGDWHSEGFSLDQYSEKNDAFLGFYDYYLPRHTRAIVNDPWPQLDNPKIVRVPNLFNFYRTYKYLIPTSTNHHEYALEGSYYEGDEQIHMISFKPENMATMRHQLKKLERNPGFSLSHGIYHVNVSSHAISQIDFAFENGGIQFSGILKFMRMGNRYIKHYMSVRTDFDKAGIRHNTTEEIFWSDFDLDGLPTAQLVNKYDMDPVSQTPGKRSSRAIYKTISRELRTLYPGIILSGLDWIVYYPKYDPSFWSKYLSPPNAVISKIENDLERFGSLAKQFETNKFQLFYEKQNRAK